MSEHAGERTVEATFEIEDWQQEAYDDEAGDPLFRARLVKRYDGPLVGRGSAVVLMAGAEADGGYVACERVVGTLEGREGSFVVQHSGLAEGGQQSTHGHVVPGTATGDLTGLRGTAVENARGVLSLRYSLPDA